MSGLILARAGLGCCGSPAAISSTILTCPLTFRHQLLSLRWCAWEHGCNAFRIDVEGEEGQRFVAGVPPLVHEAERFVYQGTWPPGLDLAANRVRPRAG